MGAPAHYEASYFKWQKSIGRLGGWANIDKFVEHLEGAQRVVDFGCGGGFLLRNITAKEKFGVEVNPEARRNASELGIATVADAAQLQDDWADLIISNHALEHVERPLDELRKLHPKLRPGGKIVFVIPCESFRYAYSTNDTNHHLYSWSPQAAGNLFEEAGFTVIECKPYRHAWRESFGLIARYLGRRWFNVASRIYARMWWRDTQVRVVATKPASSVTSSSSQVLTE